VTGDPQRAALTAFLAARPAARARLLAVHVDDDTGQCRACTIGGQAGRPLWPCSIATAAQAAPTPAQGPDQS
jgi:hypothetical protein